MLTQNNERDVLQLNINRAKTIENHQEQMSNNNSYRVNPVLEGVLINSNQNNENSIEYSDKKNSLSNQSAPPLLEVSNNGESSKNSVNAFVNAIEIYRNNLNHLEINSVNNDSTSERGQVNNVSDEDAQISKKLIPQAFGYEFPIVPICTARILCFVNIFIPGLGTLILGCFTGTLEGMCNLSLLAIAQFIFTPIFFIGWVWALTSSIELIEYINRVILKEKIAANRAFVEEFQNNAPSNIMGAPP